MILTDKRDLMDKPSMPMQPFCPVCGRTDLPMENHHVVHRSQGGEDGPTVPLCKACHALHHDAQYIRLGWSEEWSAWSYYKDDPNGRWNLLVEHSEYRQDAPESDAERLSMHEAELLMLLEMGGKCDYLIAAELKSTLADLGGDRKALTEWFAERFDFKPRSVGSYISKRLRYAELDFPGVENLGITRGYKVAQLADKGHDAAKVAADMATMPREQFDAEYGIERKARKCPHCGEAL